MQITIIIITFLISLILTKWLIIKLTKSQILDLPNQRSNHKTPTARGGGIAIMIALTFGLMALKLGSNYYYLLAAAIILSVINFYDDIKRAPIWLRFTAQIVAVIMVTQLLPEGKYVFQGVLSLLFDRICAAIMLLWFINCFNFMDGIDGIAATEAIFIALAIAIIVFISPIMPVKLGYLALLIITSNLGFLYYNWHPAKIFMGDVGSVPLGLILGWMLMVTACYGYWCYSLIIPGYYLADSGITIIKRLIQGKKIWQAHSEHFYQQAVRKNYKHSQVVFRIIILNILLLICALMSLNQTWYLALAVILTLALLFIFRNLPNKDSTN